MIPSDSPAAGPHRSVDLLFLGADGRILLQFRDSRARLFPLTWGFWGGSVDPGDASVEAAGVREAREELGLELTEAEFVRAGLRTGSTGAEAHLLRCRRPVGWRDITILEGSGAGFFTLAEMHALPVTKAVRFYLDQSPHVLC